MVARRLQTGLLDQQVEQGQREIEANASRSRLYLNKLTRGQGHGAQDFMGHLVKVSMGPVRILVDPAYPRRPPVLGPVGLVAMEQNWMVVNKIPEMDNGYRGYE